jgi:UDP-glucose 4-epimerase
MTNYLITGVTGTLGRVLTQKLLDRGDRVVGISRDEQKQRSMPADEPKLRLRLADVRDPDSLRRVARSFPDFDQIFHLAALKCVDTLEHQPEEAFLTNVVGTKNVADLASETGARMILTSTDKACYPVNAYGQSKALAEKIVISRAQSFCRYGNVLGSRGSFLPLLQKSLLQGGLAHVTDPEMTRFWMTVDEAADFVISCADQETTQVVPDNIRACSVREMVDAVADIYGVTDYAMEVFGSRAGEKIHETLRTSEEGKLLTSNDPAVRFSPDELKAFLDIALEAPQ